MNKLNFRSDNVDVLFLIINILSVQAIVEA